MPRVLVTEDNQDLRDLPRAILELEGHAVDASAGADGAFERLRGPLPDALLIHSRVAAANVRAFVAACRRDIATAWLPIVVLGGPAQAAATRDLTVDAFVSMPFDLDDLLGVVTGLAGRERTDSCQPLRV